MKSLKHYLQQAQKEKWAIGQFNFSDASQMEGIIEAAKNLNSPIILGTSEGESRFMGLEKAVALRDAYRKELGLPIFLNLDHGKTEEYILKAIDCGYDMVHFDGSKLPLADNIAKTENIIKAARIKGALAEGEVGVIGNESSKVYEEKFVINPEDLTKPDEVRQYIKDSAVDCLAVYIGNFHGISKAGNPKLDIQRLKQINKVSGESFLVLHGGSGIKDGEIKKAIKAGIVKININTELRVAYTENLKKSLEQEPGEVTPYKYLPKAIKAVQKVVEEKIILFGSKNKI